MQRAISQTVFTVTVLVKNCRVCTSIRLNNDDIFRENFAFYGNVGTDAKIVLKICAKKRAFYIIVNTRCFVNRI